MTSLSSVSSGSSAWSNYTPPRPGGDGGLAQRLLKRFDSDGSGSVDSSELQSLLEDVSQKTGLSLDSGTASKLLSASDSDGSGSLSGQELASALQSVLPPTPSTLDFAQSRTGHTGSSTSRTGQGSDDLFSRLDRNSDSSVSADELQSLLDQIATDTGSGALNASDVISQLDSDGNGSLSASELDAARPQDPAASQGMPPPPPPPDSLSASAGNSNSGGSGDALQALFNAVDSDQSGDISSSEADSFLNQLASQLDSGDSSNNAASASSGSSTGQDLAQLVQAAQREYQAHMQGGWAQAGDQFSARA